MELYLARTGQRGLGMIIGALKTALDQGRFRSIDERRSFKDLYMLLKLWTQHYTAVCRSVEEKDGERRLVLSLTDISVISQPLLSQFPTTVLFGDTFYPHELYANILGARFDRAIARTYGDAKQMKMVSVVSLGNVDTSFKNRDKEHFTMIARNLERVLSTTPGTSLVLFPSYLLLEEVCSLASLEDMGKKVIRETKGMGWEEREQLREEALSTPGATLLSVQGGTLMRAMEEGILVPGSVVMVGLHIPPPSVTSNQQRLHMQTKLGHDPGHKASVLMPAITKVMRIVNGMAYGANGKGGLVVLMDKRYQDRRVLECFPRSYGIKLLGSEMEFSGERFLRGDGG
jgi:Rad3-related DNA helicase